ncbi:FAD-dependent oxidoreductase [Sulfurospirillum sp. T05]|uniref:FAD-dependent oxidoreductase n=1 Tax=Sulfurospirillum tamanense TaxID=2813362 RepID=A0ABS2WNW3_9BACT|nr:FAD-dependent oxidoreductase [Sulfurospirillum tamanensis]MBN2963376.1 FAD-dependent oxidoreductase [Sulfurospirillum tamanensis]
MQHSLVIIGGGYAGTTLVFQLARTPNLRITLIDASPVHLVQAKLHRYLAGDLPFEEVAYDLGRFCTKYGADFVQERVTHVDPLTKHVYTENETFSYDTLVVATGCTSFFPKQIENIHAHTIDVKLPSHLQEAKKRTEALFEDKEHEHTIAIIGGGLSGAEIALELAQKAKRFPHVHIALVEQKPTPLPGMDAHLTKAALKACETLRIKRYHGAFVTAVNDRILRLSDEREVPFSLALFVIGVSPTLPTFTPALPLTPHGLVETDAHYRVRGLESIFALGDIVCSYDANGNQNLPTAQVAKQQAKHVAKTLKALLAKRALPRPKPVINKGVLVDLGGKNAAGLSFGVPLWGKPAYLVKRLVCRLHTRIF